MKRLRIFKILGHAAVMTGRTIKSYALLSVTIVLSFSLLLGYLLYTDASLYNQYKSLFRLRREVLEVSYGTAGTAKAQAFMEQASQIGQTHCVNVFEALSRFDTSSVAEHNGAVGHIGASIPMDIVCVPDHTWAVLDWPNELTVTWLDGREDGNITLASDEILMNEGVFYALGLDEQEEPEFSFTFSKNSSTKENTRFTARVVGLLRDPYPLKPGPVEGVFGSEENPYYRLRIVVSSKTVNPLKYPQTIWSQYTLVYTDSPELVGQLAESMNCRVDSVYEYQNEALEQIRNEKSNKATIASALLLLLGINLYSSFTNALNDRKYEIGIKRAIGASGWSIVRQFLYESIIVMVANTVLSVVLVVDFFIVYKYIVEHIPNELGNYSTWIIYISPHSIAMFAICAVTLTVVFSLIFAYKSTRVEIIRYLKAE